MPEGVTAIKSANEMAAEIQGKSPSDATIADTDPKAQRDYKFTIEYTDPRGKIWKGEFQNRILSIGQKSHVGVLRARLSGGLPIASLDAYTGELNEMVAHMTTSLIDRPDWAQELDSLLDDVLLTRIYEEVASHEARFRGGKPDKEKSSGAIEGEERTQQPSELASK